MRFLTVASRYQVQLGWLRVIADAIGDGRMGIDEVARILLGSREHFNRWWEEAGHAPPARGIAQPATANRAARIGATYGIHDADGKGALTPLGHVLRHLGPWRAQGESPFAWHGALRWLGLWMVFSASGDVLLEVFRSWPAEGLDSDDASDFMADILRRLSVGASGEGRKLLRNQASRSAGEPRFARNFLIYPYLEPVRDLGYLESHGRAGGYRLTPTGRRLVEALSDSRDAEAWLEDGLHRAFLIAEGATQPQPASAAVFPLVLDHLPPGVSRTPGRAPLPIVLLLAQARLVETQRVLEPLQARRLLDDAIQRAGGAVRLEGDTLCWEPSAINADLWSGSPASFPAIVQPPPSPSPALSPALSPSLSPAAATAVAASPAPLPAVPLSVPSEPVQLAGARGRVLLWLQHVAERLRAPTAGWPLRWGGPRAALARLQAALRAGVAQETADAEPLRLALADISPVEGEALLQRAAERWGSDLADVALRATLERAERAAESLVAELRARVLAGLAGEGAWSSLAAATDALLEDAVALDGRCPAALLAGLHGAAQQHPPAAAAGAFLELLLAPPQAFTYVRQVAGALPETTDTVAGVEVVAVPGPAPQRQVWVHLAAHDADAALRQARARAEHVVAVLAYAARLSEAPPTLSETLSPPAPPPAPLVGGLLLAPPASAALSLAGLPWSRLEPVPGDVGRLAQAVQGMARARRAAEAWLSLRELAPDPLAVLPAAGALAFAGAWLVEGLYAVEAALHDAALGDPQPERLVLLRQWRGEAAAQQAQAAAQLPAALRALRYPPPPPRPLAEALDLLLGRPLEDWGVLVAQIEVQHPLAAQRLRAVVEAAASPARLSAAAGVQQVALRAMLRALSAAPPAPPWGPPEPAALLPRLRAAVDPLLADAVAATQRGEALDLHWGAVLDRFDDLRSLGGPVSAARLLEILGAR